jgi:hypothetical protein
MGCVLYELTLLYLMEIKLNILGGRFLAGGGVAKARLKGWQRRGGFQILYKMSHTRTQIILAQS